MIWNWSYLIMVLCATVTSSRIMDFLDNRTGFHDNLISDVKDEKVLTPPTASGLIIDSNGYPGNSNEEKIENISTEDLPQFFKEVLALLFNQTAMSNFDMIPFSKEDIIKVQYSKLCRIICESGTPKPPCKCKKNQTPLNNTKIYLN